MRQIAEENSTPPGKEVKFKDLTKRNKGRNSPLSYLSIQWVTYSNRIYLLESLTSLPICYGIKNLLFIVSFPPTSDCKHQVILKTETQIHGRMNQDVQCSECWNPPNLHMAILISRGMVSEYRTLGKWLGNEGEIVTSVIRPLKRWSTRYQNPRKQTTPNLVSREIILNSTILLLYTMCSQGFKSPNPRSLGRIRLCSHSHGL